MVLKKNILKKLNENQIETVINLTVFAGIYISIHNKYNFLFIITVLCTCPYLVKC